MKILLVPIIAAVLAVAFIAYRGTIPGISKRLRIFLTALRGAALVILVILLADPKCSRRQTVTETPIVAILIDRSESMDLPAEAWDEGRGSSRFEAAGKVAERLAATLRSRGATVLEYYFSDAIICEAGDSVPAPVQGTDIANSLLELSDKLEGENLCAVVVLSDGVETSPGLRSPELPGVPVFTVGFGDTLPPEDVGIRDVDYNAIVRVPSKTTIKVVLSASGTKSKKVRLRLLDGGDEIFGKDVVVPSGKRSVTEKMTIPITKEGRKNYLLAADVKGEDFERANNSREIVIDAEKAEVKVLVVSMSPDWELHFITRLLKREKMYSFDVMSGLSSHSGSIALKDPGEFRKLLPNYDLVVLGSLADDFPTADDAAALADFVENGSGGLLALPGRRSLYEMASAWRDLEAVLPLAGVPPIRFKLRYTEVLPGKDASMHPVTSDLLPILSRTEWQERAPFLGFHSGLKAKPGARILLETAEGASPVLAYGEAGAGRVALLAAGPIWRWKFLAEDRPVYDELMSRLLDVLARGEEAGRFSLTVRKNVYEAGEAVVVYAELFDQRMQALTGVPVKLEVSRVAEGGEEIPYQMIPMHREDPRSTRFKARIASLPPGTYRLRGEALVRGRRLNSSPSRIKISRISVEYREMIQNRKYLVDVARRTEAAYSDWRNAADLADGLRLERRVHRAVGEIPLRTSAIVFTVVTMLLGAEWIARKRAGMI